MRNQFLPENEDGGEYMGTHRCLAYIWPVEEYKNKAYAQCYVKFLNGPFARQVGQYSLTTSIFQYYFWGVTLEMITITEKMEIVDVSDIQKEDFREFKLGIVYARTFNCNTHEVLASNGFIYKLDQSLFHNNCKKVCEHMYAEMETADNFLLALYTMNGGVIDLLLDKNVRTDAIGYKYAIHRGFVTADEKVLKGISVNTKTSTNGKEILKQEDIDKLIAHFL